MHDAKRQAAHAATRARGVSFRRRKLTAIAFTLPLLLAAECDSGWPALSGPDGGGGGGGGLMEWAQSTWKVVGLDEMGMPARVAYLDERNKVMLVRGCFGISGNTYKSVMETKMTVSGRTRPENQVSSGTVELRGGEIVLSQTSNSRGLYGMARVSGDRAVLTASNAAGTKYHLQKTSGPCELSSRSRIPATANGETP